MRVLFFGRSFLLAGAVSMRQRKPNSAPPAPKRRWYQYRLRTLFVLTAVLALWLGHVTNSARQQRKAVEALAALQAEVYYDDEMGEDGLPGPGPFAGSVLTFDAMCTGRDWTRIADAKPRGPQWLRDWVGEDYFRTVVAVEWEGTTMPDVTKANSITLEA
jgi:hypothetical protein